MGHPININYFHNKNPNNQPIFFLIEWKFLEKMCIFLESVSTNDMISNEFQRRIYSLVEQCNGAFCRK